MEKTASLMPHILNIVENKGTEQAFAGQYDEFYFPGTYLCRKCGLALYRSYSKFHSGCGWPSFDEEVKTNVKRQIDRDGFRIEILCNRCNAHLGHVFENEGLTAKNIRHCVNSLSLDFVNDQHVMDTKEAILAAGCFWGVEYYLKQLKGVLKTEVGYTGGHLKYPSYEDVCRGDTGHFEAIRVIYDPQQLEYQFLIQYFFEIHNPTQKNGQGPDLGQQYLSAIFYYDAEQQNTASRVIEILKKKFSPITTQLLPVSIFWPAEVYHQDYYAKTGRLPYCHHYQQKF